MGQDITEQAEQDSIADSLVAEPEAEETQATDTGAESQEAEGEVTAEAEETEQVEDAEDYLPEETSRVFPDEEINRYAEKRYPELVKALNNPNTPEPTRNQIRQILHDKVNTDVYLRTLQQQQQEIPEEELEPEPEPEPTQLEQPVSREQYFASLKQMVQQRTDPQVATDFYTQFMKTFGVSDQEIAALAPQQAVPFTQIMSTYALNLFNTFAQDLIGNNFQHYADQAYPGFGNMYQRATAASSWDSVRNSVDNGHELPAYGTKDFAQTARQIGAEIAGSAERFEKMVFTDARGNPLSPSANIAEKHRMIAERMLAGEQEQVTPAIVAQAVKTGQQLAQRSQITRNAGNLGSGKSKGQIAQQADDDDIFTEGMEIYKLRQGSL